MARRRRSHGSSHRPRRPRPSGSADQRWFHGRRRAFTVTGIERTTAGPGRTIGGRPVDDVSGHLDVSPRGGGDGDRHRGATSWSATAPARRPRPSRHGRGGPGPRPRQRRHGRPVRRAGSSFRLGRTSGRRRRARPPAGRRAVEHVASSSADRAVLKVFRRLATGRNPELEMLRFLARAPASRHVAPPAGLVRGATARCSTTLGVAQELVASTGATGGSSCLETLRWDAGGLLAHAPSARRRRGHAPRAARRRTPTTPTSRRVDGGRRRRHRRWPSAIGRRRRGRPRPSWPTRPAAGDLAGRAPTWPPCAARPGRPTSTPGPAIRHHGDLHLGQTLLDADAVGDPRLRGRAGPTARRAPRERRSPLRDVAGMLRSLRLRGWPRPSAPAHRLAPGWEPAARAAFLDGYLASADPTTLPDAAGGHPSPARRCSSWRRSCTRSATRSPTARLGGDPCRTLRRTIDRSREQQHDPSRRRARTEAAAPGSRRRPPAPASPPSAPSAATPTGWDRRRSWASSTCTSSPRARTVTCGTARRPRRTVDGEVGVTFAVWAPARPRGPRRRRLQRLGPAAATHAPARVVGRVGALRARPAVAGARYKFADHRPRRRTVHEQADPLASTTEVPPATASVVHRVEPRWGDDDWMRPARTRPTRSPSRCRSTRSTSARGAGPVEEADRELHATASWPTSWPSTCVDLGFTHVELLPVMGHPFAGSWGYQVTVVLRPVARAGARPTTSASSSTDCTRPASASSSTGCPPTSPRDEWALARFDGTPLYEHADPRRGAHPDWGTLVFDYGRNEVRNFLISNALFWVERVPRRRPPRRRRRLDALPRLLPQARRVGAQPLRRPRGPRRRRRSSRS